MSLYDSGVDTKSAQYYLGHADTTMTINLYKHLSNERENTARSAIITYLDKWFRSQERCRFTPRMIGTEKLGRLFIWVYSTFIPRPTIFISTSPCVPINTNSHLNSIHVI